MLRVIRGVDEGTNETRSAKTEAENVLLLASQEVESAAHRSLSRHCLRLLLLSRNHDTDIINNSITVLRGFSMVLETANETADESWRTRFSFMPYHHFHLPPRKAFYESVD